LIQKKKVSDWLKEYCIYALSIIFVRSIFICRNAFVTTTQILLMDIRSFVNFDLSFSFSSIISGHIMKEIKAQEVFLEAGYQISPKAVEMITSHSAPNDLISYILENVDESLFVIEAEHIDIESFEKEYPDLPKECLDEVPCSNDTLTSQVSSVPSTRFPARSSISSTPSPTSSSATLRDERCFSDSNGQVNNINIMSDITDMSTCVGEYMEFVQYFRNRYTKLSNIIRGRVTARPIESLNKNRKQSSGIRRSGGGDYNEASIIGMVSEIRTTANGHKMIQLEDPTGSFPVLVHQAEKDLFEEASKIILDEVIGITGSMTNDGSLLIAKKLVLPDLPNISNRREGTWGKAVFTSDIHVGSSTFLEEEWCGFLDFLNGKTDNEQLKKMSEEIRFLVVAGDLVDGIGIFPGQEHELDILDIYDQYRKAAEYFD